MSAKNRDASRFVRASARATQQHDINTFQTTSKQSKQFKQPSSPVQ